MASYRFEIRDKHHCSFCGLRFSLRDDTRCNHCWTSFKDITEVQTTCFRVMFRRRLFRQMYCGIPKAGVNLHFRSFPYEIYDYEFGIFGRTISCRSNKYVGGVCGSIKRANIQKLIQNQAELDAVCGFEHVEKSTGWGSARVLPRGDIAVICPPLLITHRITEGGEHHLNAKLSWVIVRADTGVTAFDLYHPFDNCEYSGGRDPEQCIRNQVYNIADKLRNKGLKFPKHKYIPFFTARPLKEPFVGGPVPDILIGRVARPRCGGVIDNLGATAVRRNRHIRFCDDDPWSSESDHASLSSDETYEASDVDAGDSSDSELPDPAIDDPADFDFHRSGSGLEAHASDASDFPFVERGARSKVSRRSYGRH
jgi:hypothetical protein